MRNWCKFLSRWRRPKLSDEDAIMTRLFGSDDIVSQRDALQIEVDRLTKQVEEQP